MEGGNVSSHSFRRGGAVWLLSCKVPGEVIKVMGDWKSKAYLAYLDQLCCRLLSGSQYDVPTMKMKRIVQSKVWLGGWEEKWMF